MSKNQIKEVPQNNTSRFQELAAESLRAMAPIQGYEKMPLDYLDQAVSLSKLPSTRRWVNRSVKADLHYLYSIGKIFVWWRFSSCTLTLEVLQSEDFLGKKGMHFRKRCS